MVEKVGGLPGSCLFDPPCVPFGPVPLLSCPAEVGQLLTERVEHCTGDDAGHATGCDE